MTTDYNSALLLVNDCERRHCRVIGGALTSGKKSQRKVIWGFLFCFFISHGALGRDTLLTQKKLTCALGAQTAQSARPKKSFEKNTGPSHDKLKKSTLSRTKPSQARDQAKDQAKPRQAKPSPARPSQPSQVKLLPMLSQAGQPSRAKPAKPS